MASTRNKNTLDDYLLENNKNMYAFENYTFKGRIYENHYFAGNGLIHGSLPANVLSKNHVDIETHLFGINSTNLVFPKENTTPDFSVNSLNSLNISNKLPIFLPRPLILDKNERPFSIFS
jgi:hypothetical protein